MGKNEDGAVLAELLKGSRFESLMGNLERGIKGPYYYGDEPSAVDFFLLQHLDWRCSQVFDPLKARGYDALAPYPKICAIQAALQAADGYKNYKGRPARSSPRSSTPSSRERFHDVEETA